MAVKVEQYGKDPIFIVTLTDRVTHDDINAMYHECASFRSASGQPAIWRIIDMTRAQIEFPVVMDIIRHLDASQAGSLADESMRTMFAGFHPMANLLRDMLAKQSNGDVHTPVFRGLGEALMFAQDEIYGFTDSVV